MQGEIIIMSLACFQIIVAVPKELYILTRFPAHNGLLFTHYFIHQWVTGAGSPIGSSLELNVLPKDTLNDWAGTSNLSVIGPPELQPFRW